MRRLSVVPLAVLLFLPVALQSQPDSSARLMGYAKSSFNGRPLAGVMIAVPHARKFVVTDSSGTFLLAGLPAGPQKVSIAYQGRETEEYVFELRPGRTMRLAVLLDVDAVDLDPIVVEARNPVGWKDLAGFYERRRFYGSNAPVQSGFHNFYTREEIESEGFRSVGDVLRRMRVTTRCVDNGCVPTITSRGVPCPVRVAVNGVANFANEYESVLIDDVQGVEWYAGQLGPPNLVPLLRIDYPHDPSLQREIYGPVGVQSCGTIAIWTR